MPCFYTLARAARHSGGVLDGFGITHEACKARVVRDQAQSELPADVSLLRAPTLIDARLKVEEGAVVVAEHGEHLIEPTSQHAGTAACLFCLAREALPLSHFGEYGGKMSTPSETPPSTAPLTEIMAADWAEALSPVEPRIRGLGRFLREELSAGRSYLPSGDNIFRAFSLPLSEVRVVIVGQDPYPTPGHPIGLSFAVDRDVRPLPRSLANIYRELEDDLGVTPPEHGDLSGWLSQGVMLLNRALTVQPGLPGSHRGKGWEDVTDCALSTLAKRGGPLVAILWGRDAQKLAPLLRGVQTIESAHPSPLSARRGFFGSHPFSRTNELLVAQGGSPISWQAL